MSAFPQLSSSLNGVENKIKNWDKPGGKMGTILAWVLGGLGVVALYKALPYLITLASNLITLMFLLGVIAAILFLITNKQVRRLVSTLWFMVMRKLTGLVIELDPIAIVERQIETMNEKLKTIRTIMGNLKGLIIKNETNIKVKKKELDENILRVKEYETRGERAKSQVAANQVKRLDEYIKNLLAYNDQSVKYYDILKKLQEMAELTVLDSTNEITMRKEQFKLVKEQHKAFKSVMSIIKGDPDEMAMFTQAMDFMADDITRKLGEMEDIINSAGGVLDEYEITKGVVGKQAAEIVKRYDEFGIEGMFSNFGDGQKAIEQGKTNFIKNGKLSNIQEAEFVEVHQETKQIADKYFSN